jgi:hypothetical protein
MVFRWKVESRERSLRADGTLGSQTGQGGAQQKEDFLLRMSADGLREAHQLQGQNEPGCALPPFYVPDVMRVFAKAGLPSSPAAPSLSASVALTSSAGDDSGGAVGASLLLPSWRLTEHRAAYSLGVA